MPTTVLALSYWLHLLATIVWIGGLAALVLLVPGALAGETGDQVYRRFARLSNLSLAVLLVSGMVQLVGEKAPNYQGMLNFASLWAQIILAKHRNGPTGAFHIRFRQKISRFEDLLIQPEDFAESAPDAGWDEA